jgi:dTDP-4-amino-4,6-dideoxygalactose transaminase
MIPIASPFLPPQNEYQKYLDGIWKRKWLTNNGPLVNEFELKLKDYLKVKHLLFVTNGTIALQIAIKALDLKGEIITTPFSYIATTSSLVWEGCTPIYADIDAASYNIDPNKIEALITEKTSAILATHVYGNPCDIEAIESIAKRNNLKVIYDAAHCFGVEYKGKSVFEYGDISTTSFHATKLFHTIEGGAVFTKDQKLLKKLAFMKNFGHYGPENFVEVGINGKNSEFHAAMGLCNLNYIDVILAKRKSDYEYYIKSLKPLNMGLQQINTHANYNYSYFPILFENESITVSVFNRLSDHEIYARRYFYPTLDNASYMSKSKRIPISIDVAKRVLCLPLSYYISREEIDMIGRNIQRTLKYK